MDFDKLGCALLEQEGELMLNCTANNKSAFVKYFVEKDKAGALELFIQSADAGDPLASYLVALSHMDVDRKLAFKYMLVSAQNYHPRALILCADMYRSGSGVRQSDVSAMALYRKAAAAYDDCEAMFKMAELILKTGCVDKKEAMKWFGKAHEGGYPHAGLNVAKMWIGGNGVEKNVAKALDIHRTLIKEHNCIISRRILAQCLCLGDGCEQDLPAALALYKEGADVYGDVHCMACAAYASKNGYGLKEPDLNMAFEYYTKAANKGVVHAMYELGEIYRTKLNYKLAIRWYLKSAKEGNKDAKKAMGDMHRDGLGVPQNESISKRWYTTMLLST